MFFCEFLILWVRIVRILFCCLQVALRWRIFLRGLNFLDDIEIN